MASGKATPGRAIRLIFNQVVPFLSVSPLRWWKNHPSAEIGLASTARLGVKFFLTDSIAIGPAVEFQHTNWGGLKNSIALLGVAAVHF